MLRPTLSIVHLLLTSGITTCLSTLISSQHFFSADQQREWIPAFALILGTVMMASLILLGVDVTRIFAVGRKPKADVEPPPPPVEEKTAEAKEEVVVEVKAGHATIVRQRYDERVTALKRSSGSSGSSDERIYITPREAARRAFERQKRAEWTGKKAKRATAPGEGSHGIGHVAPITRKPVPEREMDTREQRVGHRHERSEQGRENEFKHAGNNDHTRSEMAREKEAVRGYSQRRSRETEERGSTRYER